MHASWFLLAAAVQVASTQFVAEFSDYVRGERWVSTITADDLRHTPPWRDEDAAPPLPARRAAEIALREVRSLVADADKWRLNQISLRQIGSPDQWVYLVQVEEPPPRSDGGVHGAVSIVVLMDGSRVTPRREPWPSSPAPAVSQFYTEYLKQPVGGLVSGAQLEALRPMMSGALHRSIVKALEYQEAWSRKHPDEKPPFVDGDHFTSVFEGAKSFDIVRVAGERVRVRFHAPGASDWEDVVVVKKESGRYVIDDVIYGGAGPFNPKGRLSERLRARDQ